MYDYIKTTESGATRIRVATIQHGVIDLILNPNELSLEYQHGLYAQLLASGMSEQDVAIAVAEEVQMRLKHAAIISLCESENLWGELIQLLGNNPSTWFQNFCTSHNL